MYSTLSRNNPFSHRIRKVTGKEGAPNDQDGWTWKARLSDADPRTSVEGEGTLVGPS